MSVLRGKGYLRGPLSSSWRIISLRPDSERSFTKPLPSGHCRLAVDFHPEKVFDLADATKVAVQHGRVMDIGKGIKNYNAIDTGIFLCSPGIFDALETAISRGKESLSDGIRELAARIRMEAMDIGDLFWQDVDDESSRLEVEKRLLQVKGGETPNASE